MSIELICVGDELLKGQIINTNLTDIGMMLFREGYRLSRSDVVADDAEQM